MILWWRRKCNIVLVKDGEGTRMIKRSVRRMGSVSFVKSYPYTIALGQSNGPAVLSGIVYEDASGMLISAPAVLAEGITIQVNSAKDGTGIWSTLQDDVPADKPGPTAGKARFYPELINAAAFRLVASAGVAADRVFTLHMQWTV